MNLLRKREYYNNKDSWIGGPIFELTLVLDPKVNGKEIFRLIESEWTLITFGHLVKPHSLVNSVFYLEKANKFGAQHYFYTRKTGPLYTHYDIGIRPSELMRLLGEYPGRNSEWKSLDKNIFKSLLDLFISIARKIHENFSLKYATINDETNASVNPIAKVPSGIYID